MVKNRFFKNTLGIFAQIIIASAIDAEETNSTGGSPSVISVPVTIAADPTPGDTITITVDGVEYKHTIPVADQTTQQAHDSIAAMLAANTQGFVLSSHTGTTSSVYQLAWAGADKNGKAVTLAETGSTFTVAGPYAFADGVDADAAAADDLETFVASSNAGTIWAFWEDINSAGKKVALKAGDTKNPANINRSFFYAWKDSAGVTHTTTAIPVSGLRYDSKAYNAGQVQISIAKYGGTISATQRIHVRIQDTTATNIPYPSWSYDTLFNTDIATTVAALAALVNAETEEPIVSASAGTDELTITGLYKNRTFKVTAFVEVSATAATDASNITFPTGGTQKAIAPIGDLATIQEMEKFQNIHGGGINYAPEGTNVDEWQTAASNIGSTTEWGILMVYAHKVENGIVRNHEAQAYVVIAVPTGVQATLAAL